MRYNEFQLNENELRELARRRYPHLTEEQLDEVLPAIAAVAGRAAMGAAKMGAKAVGAAAKTAGKIGAKMGTAAVKGAAKVAGGAAKSAGQKLAQKAAGKVQQKAVGKMAQQVLKPGVKLPMPDATGKEQEFEIDSVKGKEVTLKNPEANKPGQPLKTVHDKKDLDPILQQLAGVQQ